MTDQNMQSSDMQYCLDKCESSNSNFVTAFKLMPPERRAGLYSFYAICREVDDVADNPDATVDSKTRALEAWRLEIDACYENKATHPATRIFQQAVNQFAIPKQHLVDLLDGVSMDLNISRYETFDDLYKYCFGVASAVGMVCTYIFGCKNKQSLDYAEALGLAFQLTNILRDVKVDLENDRIYIPQEDLRSFSYSEEELAAGVMNRNFEQLMYFQYQRANKFYEKARRLLPKQDRDALLPSRLMTSYYRALLERICAKKFNVFNQRISLPKIFKASMFAFYWPKLALSKWRISA
jgi:phytoene synthase